MADRTYLVQVTAGVHSWTVTDTDAPDYGLMDPLTIGWSLPDAEHRPNQPDTMVAGFSVVAPSAELLDDLVLGSPVTIAVTFGPGAKPVPDITFYGRIAQGEATAHSRGMLYRFTAADLTTDLNGYDIGADPYAAQPVPTRMTTMVTRAGLLDTQIIRDPTVAAADTNLYVDVIDQPSAAQLLQSVIDLWDQVALQGLAELSTTSYRAIIAPYPPAEGARPDRWALDAVSEAYIPSAAAPLPATFGQWFPLPDAWGLAMDPDDRAAGVIDACFVEFGSSWAAIQPAIVNKAGVIWLTTVSFGVDANGDPYERTQRVTYNTENPPPVGHSPTMAIRETSTINANDVAGAGTAVQANATRLGGMMVPVPQNPAGWGPDSFRWLLYADDIGQRSFPVIFPRHDATGAPTPRVLRTAAYVRPITVVNVPNEWNAADFTRDWIAGQLAAVTLTIEDGRPVIDFQLLPTVPEPGNPSTSANAWNVQIGTWDAFVGTWNDQSPARPAFRWDDAALAGRVWNDIHPQPWNMYRLARGTS